jgi:4'-phosphopantetheinyl transferase
VPPPERRPAGDAIPRPRRGQCQVWWARPDAADPRLLELLDDDERNRHIAYLRASDRDRFLVAHALARIVTGAALAAATPSGRPVDPSTIRYAPRAQRRGAAGGKPRFAGAALDAGLELSISHSAERVVVALSRAVPIGIDVERLGRGTLDRSLAESVLAPAELRALGGLPRARQAAAFCVYWTRKEAVLKATGDGLAVEPRKLVVSPPGSPPALLDWSGPRRPAATIALRDLDPGPGYAATLASIGTRLECTEHDGDRLLAEWAEAPPRGVSHARPAAPASAPTGSASHAAPPPRLALPALPPPATAWRLPESPRSARAASSGAAVRVAL